MSLARELRRKPEALAGLAFVLPMVALFLVVRLVPALGALYLSFTEYSITDAPRWIGLANYVRLLDDDIFRRAVWNTVLYTVGTVLPATALALVFAMMLDQKIKGLAVFRTAYYIPVVASMVTVSMIWLYIFNAQFGVLNYALSLLNIPRQGWLDDPALALPSIILIGIWKNLGYNIVIYLAGLQGIPAHLYEAARVDGANAWRRFWSVTWPLLLPTTLLIWLMTGIFALQVFDQIFVLTAGGPADSTTSVVFEIYRNGFQYFKMGYASAMAFVLFAIILTASLLSLRLSARAFRY